MELLKALTETPGAPGREERIRALITERVQPIADRITTDAMGNLMVWLDPTEPSDDTRVLAVACHMDEIAFYVRAIDSNGFIRLQPFGGFDPRNLLARRVRIRASDGTELIGNLQSALPPVHLQRGGSKGDAPKLTDLYVDAGLSAEALEGRVEVGDPVTLVSDFVEIGELVSGKALDNRVACWVGIRALEQLAAQEGPRKHGLCVCFTSQEEVGIRGAFVAAWQVQPDVALAVDVTLACDTPGVSREEHITRLGEGVAVKIADKGTISHRGLVDALIGLAKSNAIPHQREILPFGATDAVAFQRARASVPTCTLSVPCRYVHTVTETLHPSDLRACVDLLVALAGSDALTALTPRG